MVVWSGRHGGGAVLAFERPCVLPAPTHQHTQPAPAPPHSFLGTPDKNHQIMTWGQYAEAAYTIARRKWYGKDKVAPYIPDFTRCCDHFCLHAGERRRCPSVSAGALAWVLAACLCSLAASPASIGASSFPRSTPASIHPSTAPSLLPPSSTPTNKTKHNTKPKHRWLRHPQGHPEGHAAAS